MPQDSRGGLQPIRGVFGSPTPGSRRPCRLAKFPELRAAVLPDLRVEGDQFERRRGRNLTGKLRSAWGARTRIRELGHPPRTVVARSRAPSTSCRSAIPQRLIAASLIVLRARRPEVRRSAAPRQRSHNLGSDKQLVDRDASAPPFLRAVAGDIEKRKRRRGFPRVMRDVSRAFRRRGSHQW